MADITDLELVEKYGKLCGHIAWNFVRRHNSGLKLSEQISSTLGTEDAEDFASAALIRLIKCPAQHRDNKWYISRLIANRIIEVWKKRLKQINAEEAYDDFDSLNGPDGLAGKTQVKFDFEKVSRILPEIPHAERIVLELKFGLNGCEPCPEERIAKKLGRTRHWTQTRIQKGLEHIREQINQPVIATV